jgi:hypothetical protein
MLSSLTVRASRVRLAPIMRPIVAVIGTTGVGKSQLAVHLAQSLNALSPNGSPEHNSSALAESSSDAQNRYKRGLVLSADSMQLYKGLDVITNKVTQEEMAGVEHWGLDIVQPGRGASWELGKWCSEADKVVRLVELLLQDEPELKVRSRIYPKRHYLLSAVGHITLFNTSSSLLLNYRHLDRLLPVLRHRLKRHRADGHRLTLDQTLRISTLASLGFLTHFGRLLRYGRVRNPTRKRQRLNRALQERDHGQMPSF